MAKCKYVQTADENGKISKMDCRFTGTISEQQCTNCLLNQMLVRLEKNYELLFVINDKVTQIVSK